MKLLILITFCLFSSPLIAGELSVEDLRKLLKDSTSLSENDLKLGQPWDCRILNYDKNKKEFIAMMEPHVEIFYKVRDENIYGKRGTHSIFILSNAGLVHDVPVDGFDVERLATDNSIVSEVMMSEATAEFAGVPDLPRSVLLPTMKTVTYSRCELKQEKK